MSDVQEQPTWWVASNGRWYPPLDEAPKPGWWLASDGQWYPPKKVKRAKAKAVASSTPTEQLPSATATATATFPASPPMSYEAARELAAGQAPGAKPWGLALLVIIGGVLMAVGGFLPWGTVSFGTISVSVDGTYGWGDGWIAFGIGVVLLLAGSALWGLRGVVWRVLPIVVAAAGVALAIYEVVHISSFGHPAPRRASAFSAQLGVAYGLIIVLVGAVAGAVGGIGALATWNRWGVDGL
jgi:hypothetical protein